MSYIEQFTLPPEFRDDMFLSSAQLNQLGEAIGYLDGVINYVNPAQPGFVLDRNLSTTNNTWRIRHDADCGYIHVKVSLVSGPLSENFRIYVHNEAGTQLSETTIASSTTDGTYTQVINVSGLGLADAEWYRVHVRTGGGSSYTVKVHYIFETDKATIGLTWPTVTGQARPSSGPFSWQHGDTAGSAPTFDLYSDWLNYLRDRVGQYLFNPAVLEDREQAEAPSTISHEDSSISIWHTKPWLVFRGTGEIYDPAGVSQSVTLSDEDKLTAFDLSAIDWLSYGDWYIVRGCDFAAEVEEIA